MLKHAEFSRLLMNKTLAELRTIYTAIVGIYGPDSGPASLVSKHIARHIKLT